MSVAVTTDSTVMAVCRDINECADNGGCHVNAECRNTEGGRECRCNDGFGGDGTVRTSTSVPSTTVAAI